LLQKIHLGSILLKVFAKCYRTFELQLPEFHILSQRSNLETKASLQYPLDTNNQQRKELWYGLLHKRTQLGSFQVFRCQPHKTFLPGTMFL
jgi:hypothetical protein